MPDTNSQAVDALVQAMQKMSDDKIESATFDTTDIGKIEEVQSNNKYSVSIRGTVYTVPSCVSDEFSVNDSVLVLSCKNNKTEKYITGKTNVVKASGTATGDMLKSVYDTNNDGKVDSAENADTVGGFTVAKSVPANAVFTDTTYSNATASTAGLESAADKTKLDALPKMTLSSTQPSSPTNGDFWLHIL